MDPATDYNNGLLWKSNPSLKPNAVNFCFILKKAKNHRIKIWALPWHAPKVRHVARARRREYGPLQSARHGPTGVVPVEHPSQLHGLAVPPEIQELRLFAEGCQ